MIKKAQTRTLVTGGAGFLGSHLCDRLISEGHDVVCLVWHGFVPFDYSVCFTDGHG